ncbi:MerR family DNA-binding transcriptional regulator [Thermodesulfobium narugense]|uniref:MerR family DNA-binding transcriptional regulator n=1 Tax=Thermodesulfobium narugense TaxID=184064 RepID=UPI0009FC8D08
MYNITEFAKLIGVRAQTLRKWDKQGKTERINISGNVQYIQKQAEILGHDAIIP